MQPDPDPLPPLADVLKARTRKILAMHGTENIMAALESSTVSYCALMAAPYDAEMQRLRARVAELEARLAKYDALSQRAALALQQRTAAEAVNTSQIERELAAMAPEVKS